MSFDIEPDGDPHGECALEIKRLKEAFEYLVSMLPEECTAGFVVHARAIASGDIEEIEKTK